ncbi:UNVERIFIED_CONTAM: hypothetical protein Sindi_0493900 [Sesamum indicum]
MEFSAVILVRLQRRIVVQSRQVATGKFLEKRFADAHNQLARPLWLAEEIWHQLLEYWASPEFHAQSTKNKINRVANPNAAVTVYQGGSSSFGPTSRVPEIGVESSISTPEAHHTIARLFGTSGSTATSPSLPQPPRTDLDDRVARLEEWMRQMDPTWPDPPVPSLQLIPRYLMETTKNPR